MQGFLENVPRCPRCGKTLDGWSIGSDDSKTKPQAGDLTVCIYCSAVLQFTEVMELIMAPAEAILEVTFELSKMQNVVKKIRKDESK